MLFLIMRKSFNFIISFLVFITSYSQTKPLADNYFKQGEFEKALDIYQQLLQKTPNNYNLFLSLIKTYQELEEYEEAQALLIEKSEIYNNPQILIELAQNALLQNHEEQANVYYQEALVRLKERALFASNVGRVLEDYNLLEWAEEAYRAGLEENPTNITLKLRLANLYGAQGRIQRMFESYIDLAEIDMRYLPTAQHRFSAYIQEDSDTQANKIFKQVLMRKIQSDPKILYYELLSWVSVQEKNFKQAFAQEKAIHKRTSDGELRRMKDLALLAYKNIDYNQTKTIVQYILENADVNDLQTIFDAEHLLLQIAIDTAKKEDYDSLLSLFEELIEKYNSQENVIVLKMDYASFLAYRLDHKEEAIKELRKLLSQNPNRSIEAHVRLLLGDILVTDNQFNSALVQFTHVQRQMEGQALGHEANFKIAQTSYFKGDFKWALTQLDVLKRASTQLIANDAIFLNLRIQDNILGDSTQVSLKDFANADLLVLQGKTDKAIEQLQYILVEHEGKSIIDDTHYKLGELYFDQKKYEKAAKHWQIIVDEYAYDLLADSAYYRLGMLYEEIFHQSQKAMEYYEKIIFDYSDSIFYVDARKRFRKLRGDFST